VQGYSNNQKRLDQLNKYLEIVSRSENDAISGVADILKVYASGLDILDDYDHQRLDKTSKAHEDIWQLTYEDARQFIDAMKFAESSDLFGFERNESFKGSLGAIYQSFGGQELYPNALEKATMLLYFIVKNHSFTDGNKRIAAALFVYFLDKNNLLYTDAGLQIIANNTLAAITLMIALSKPAEKDLICALVLKMIEGDNK
jgi:prophage maintenance system killer protein